MKIVKIDDVLRIYGDGIEIHDKVPVGTYSIQFSKMQGFFLMEHNDLEIKEKLYGHHEEKTEKIIRSFSVFNRNLGVILSGPKGIGKSIFARLLCKKGIEAGFPVILVDTYIPGIENFISEIQQECIVFFDEYDKTFGNIGRRDGEQDAQERLLPLFDGIDNGKKLFVITCNKIDRLNEYIVNRPGRFHYHIRFDYPSSDEVREYLFDKVDPKYHGEIIHVCKFSARTPINYDCLRSISFELNMGLPFKEAIKDLNIINFNSNNKYRVTLKMNDGSVYSADVLINMFTEEEEEAWLKKNGRGYQDVNVTFNPYDGVFNAQTGTYDFEAGMYEVEYDEDSDDYEKLKNLTPLTLSLKRLGANKYQYTI